jgi:2'-5' RNA ligase
MNDVAGKTHHSAVAVVPPEVVWEPIQAIRRRYDRQINRWMPHINLLYPFRPRSDFDAAVRLLADACSTIEPFTVTLAEFRFFRHGSGRCTLWLAPEPVEELRRLQASLQAAFPDCADLSNFPAGFTPHLSVGQFASAAECERTREQLQAGWKAIFFVLGEVTVLARTGDAPFVIERRVPLASRG